MFRGLEGQHGIEGPLAFAAYRGRWEGELRRMLRSLADEWKPPWSVRRQAHAAQLALVAQAAWVERLERCAGLSTRGLLRQDLDAVAERIESEVALVALAAPLGRVAIGGSGVFGDLGG